MDFTTTIFLSALFVIMLALIPLTIYIWYGLILFIKGDDKLLNYKTCPYCGAHIDHGEYCTCVNSMYARLTADGKEMANQYIQELLASQKQNTRV